MACLWIYNAQSWKLTNNEPKQNKNPCKPRNEHNLSFLYSREFHRIGAKVLCEKVSLSKAIKKTQNPKLYTNGTENKQNTNHSNISEEIIRALESSNSHKPLQQNSLYKTSANDFGSKKPSYDTWTCKEPRVFQFI